jgi:hypothetical protein
VTGKPMGVLMHANVELMHATMAITTRSATVPMR